MITEAQLKELEHRASQTMPGPWEARLDTHEASVRDGRGYNVAQEIGREEALFLVAAKELVPELIAEVRRLRSEAEYGRNTRRLTVFTPRPPRR